MIPAAYCCRNIFRLAEFAQNTALSWPPPSGTFVLSESQVGCCRGVLPGGCCQDACWWGDMPLRR